MDISFLTMLPQFQQLSEEKKQFLIEFAMADHGNNANSAAQSLMQAIQTAKGKNISFSKEESSLLIEVLKQNMSKEEAARTDKMLKMAQNRTRAMLKVEDGCVNFCTYCIIPYARGPVRSLPMDKAAEQVRALRSQGYRELVATGIEISSYGHDLKDGTTLIDLLELIAREGGEMRIRLGSLEPRTVTREFCERAKKLPTLCPHFHLSMQSGCDATLKRMNRRYDTARYYESVELLREYFDDPAITTDLITGFPEETEEEFGETLAFIEKCGFAVISGGIRP